MLQAGKRLQDVDNELWKKILADWIVSIEDFLKQCSRYAIAILADALCQ